MRLGPNPETGKMEAGCVLRHPAGHLLEVINVMSGKMPTPIDTARTVNGNSEKCSIYQGGK